jgi:hypothetical protein
MPVKSKFYGLIVARYYLDTKQYNLPHFHLKHGEMEGIYEIPGGELFESALPINKAKLIKA